MAKKKSLRATRTGSKVAAPKNSLVVRSAESSRMTRLRSMPTAKRQAAVTAFLRAAK
ncbi:MAG: hypothetical protein JWN22_1319 [Nocardioides sp.]|jgi:hypothetical protein|nr:hypothetical protein [Nocardioides sp.]